MQGMVGMLCCLLRPGLACFLTVLWCSDCDDSYNGSDVLCGHTKNASGPCCCLCGESADTVQPTVNVVL